MSKQDTHFFNVFSVVIALLLVVAIGIFAFARVVASHTQDKQVMQEADYSEKVQGRLASPVRVAVAGQDNSALAIKVEGPAPGSAATQVPTTGTQLYEQTCSACHGQGIAGAPKVGDKAAWAARVAEGKPTLYQHAINGYTGKSGMMPPKGARMDVSDDLVKAAVDHMVQISQ